MDAPLPSPPPELSLEEWAALDEDDEGELVDGILVDEEMPSIAHEVVVSWLLGTIAAWIVPRGGYVLASESKVRVGARRGRKPDLLVMLPGSPRPARSMRLWKRAPDVVVEVVTDTPRDARRDRVEKVADYAAAGIRFYWIVEPETRVFEIFELGADRRYSIALAASDGTISVPGCADLTLDLDALWAEVASFPERQPDDEDDDDDQ